jgi:hypothetical protein
MTSSSPPCSTPSCTSPGTVRRTFYVAADDDPIEEAVTRAGLG